MPNNQKSWALITGASEGIGRSCALSLAQKGFNLILNARSLDRLNELKHLIESQFNINIELIIGDIGSLETRHALVEQGRQVDLSLVILAAGFGLIGDFDRLSLNLQLDMINVNCVAVVDLSYKLGPILKQRKEATLVLFSSIVGFQGAPYLSIYAATKNFIQSFGEGLQAEWHKSNITVLVVAPGPIATKFAERAGITERRLSSSPQIVADSIISHLGQSTTLFPGLLSKCLSYSFLILPRFFRNFITGQLMRQSLNRH